MRLLIQLWNVHLWVGGKQDNPSSVVQTYNEKVEFGGTESFIQHSAYFPLDKEDLTMEDISCFGSTLAS